MCTGEKNNLIKRQNKAQTYLHLQSATALEAKSSFLIAGEVIRRGKRQEGQLHTRYYQLRKVHAGVNNFKSQLVVSTVCNPDVFILG